MPFDNRTSDRLPANLSRLLVQWCPAIVILGILIVPLTTLFPFGLAIEDDILAQIRWRISFRTNAVDVVANLLLFMPLGFGLAGLFLKTKRWQQTTRLGAVFLVSVLLSASVEFLQVFLPTRAATVTDVFVNGTGGVLGAICFQRWGFQILSVASLYLERVQKHLFRLSMKQLAAIFLGYLLVAFAAVNLAQTTTLQSWDDSYPLLVGNWLPQNNPWQGKIADLQISDRAVSRSDALKILAGDSQLSGSKGALVAAYPMTGSGNFADQTGNLPDLVWQDRRSQVGGDSSATDRGANLNDQQWLKTNSPATPVLQRLRRNSQFTFAVTVTPASIERDPSGFKTFLSFSDAAGNYNFRLGQIGQFLLFWVRTTVNGDLSFPPDGSVTVFNDSSPLRILVSYSGTVLRIYTDRSEEEIAFNLSGTNFRVVTLGLVFAPLGLLLALIVMRLKGHLLVWLALVGSGILLPPLLLEGLMAATTDRRISLANCLLGVLVMGSILLIIHTATQFSPNKN